MARTAQRFADNPALQVTLNDEQLRQLGMLYAVWAQIDFQIVAVLGYILKVDPGAAIMLLDNVTSGVLVSSLRRLLDAIDNPNIRDETKGFCDRVGALVDKRNHLSHGIWGWQLSKDQKEATPACYFQKNKDKPLYARDLNDLLRRIMAESHTIKSIMHHFQGLPPSVDSPTPPPIYFGAFGEQAQPAAWLMKAPLAPGLDHKLAE